MKEKHILKPLPIYLSGIIIISLFIAICGCAPKHQSDKKPPKVIVAPAASKDISRYREYVGQVVSVMKEQLMARVEGYLTKRLFQEGAFVKKGQLLFQIQKSQYQANLEISKGNLLKAKSVLKNAETEFNRFKYLSDTKAVSQKTFDFAEAQKGSAMGDVLVDKGNVELAKLDLSYTDVTAPCDGRIGKTMYDVGNLVGLNSGPLATVLMYDPIYVEFNVDENMLIEALEKKEIKFPSNEKETVEVSGVQVILTLANRSEYPLPGKIVFLDNNVDPTTGTILVRGLFKNPDNLLIPGSFVTVKVETIKKIKAILIPQSSIQQDQSGPYVYAVQKDNTVDKTYVDLGACYNTEIVVNKGLKEGDLVISQGLQKVKPGVKVVPVQQKVDEPPPKKPLPEKQNNISKNSSSK